MGCRVLHSEPSAEILALSSGEVEVLMRRIAPPGHHVQNGRLHPAEATVIVDSDRLKNLYSEGGGPTCCAVAEYPLILETAPAFDTFERGDAHDKIVGEFSRNSSKTSVCIVVDPFVNDVVLLRRLHIVSVEDDLAEAHLSNFTLVVNGDVPQVERLIENLSVDVVLKGVREVGPDAKCGHEEDDAVGG